MLFGVRDAQELLSVGLEEACQDRVDRLLLRDPLALELGLMARVLRLVSATQHLNQTELLRMLLLHDAVDDAPLGEAGELGLSQVQEETVRLDVDERVEVVLLHLEGAHPRLDRGENLFAPFFNVEILQIDGELSVLVVDLLHQLLRDSQCHGVLWCELSYLKLVNLVGDVLADVDQVARALVLRRITERLLHDLLVIDARGFVVVVLPPGLIDPIIHV